MPKSRATEYAEAVLDGEIVAGKLVKLACQRHLNDLARSDLVWDQEEEDRLFVYWGRACQYTQPADLAGKPMALAPFQSFYYGSLRSWLRKEDGEFRHRFRRGLLLSGRGGAGKTTAFSGLILYYLTVLNRIDPMPECYVCCEEYKQAYDAMDSLWTQVTRNDAFEGIFRRQLDHGHVKTVYSEQHGDLTPTVAERVQVSHGEVRGPKPSLLLVEEGQSITSTNMLTELEFGGKNRPHLLTAWFANAGFDKSTPLGVLYTEAAESLRSQREFDDTFLPLIFESDYGEDLLSEPDEVIEEEIKKANPLYPVSPRKGFVWDEVRSAQTNPAKKNEILNQIFCVWTSAATAWLSADILTKAETDKPYPEGSRLFLGMDLSKTGDMSAVAEYWQWPEKDRGLLKGHCWLPRGGMEDRSKEDQARFKLWAGEGKEAETLDGPLTITPGFEINYDSIVEYIQRLMEIAEIIGMACDAAYMKKFRQALNDASVDYCIMPEEAKDIKPGQLVIVYHPQGVAGLQRVKDFNALSDEEQAKRVTSPLWMPTSLGLVENDLLNNTLLLDKGPLMRWTMQSVEVGADTNGNRYMERKPSTGGMVDLAVAGIMARGLADAWLESVPKDGNPLQAWIDGMSAELKKG